MLHDDDHDDDDALLKCQLGAPLKKEEQFEVLACQKTTVVFITVARLLRRSLLKREI